MRIWLIQDAEPLPLIDSGARLMRTALLAQKLSDNGNDVVWFSAKFDHTRKINRKLNSDTLHINANYRIHLLNGTGYKSNFSIFRILHHRSVAKNFLKATASFEIPDLILASYPSPEICKAAHDYATKNNVVFIVDIRDTWPDTFLHYLPKLFYPAVMSLVIYYRKLIKSSFRDAYARLAVSSGMLEYAYKIGKIENPNSDLDKVFYLAYPNHGKKIAIDKNEFSESQPLLCVFVGSSGRSYDTSLISRAAKLLRERNEKRIHFSLIGDHCHKNDVNLTVYGWLSEEKLHEVLDSSHIGLCFLQGGALMSKSWIGNKIFEYMSFGLAIATNDSGELMRLIENTGVGFHQIITDNDLASLLINLVNNPSLLFEKRNASYESFTKNFSSEIIYNSYCKHLEKLAQFPK